MSDDRHNGKIWAEHRHVRGQLLPWPQDQSTLDLLDTKTIQLAACTTAGTDFVRTGMRPVKWTGSAKCADLQKIIEEGPGDYIFTQTLPAEIAPAVANLLTLLRLIKSASCNVNDPLARPHLASLKEKVTILVCQYERIFSPVRGLSCFSNRPSRVRHGAALKQCPQLLVLPHRKVQAFIYGYNWIRTGCNRFRYGYNLVRTGCNRF